MIPELERVADYLIVLSGGRVQVAGDVEQLLASHQILSGPAAAVDAIGSRFDVVQRCARRPRRTYSSGGAIRPARRRVTRSQPATFRTNGSLIR